MALTRRSFLALPLAFLTIAAKATERTPLSPPLRGETMRLLYWHDGTWTRL